MRTVAGLEAVDEATDRARPVYEAGADSGDSRGCVVFSSVSSSGDLIANGLLIELPNSPGMVKVGQPKSGLGTSGRWSMLVAKKWSDSGRVRSAGEWFPAHISTRGRMPRVYDAGSVSLASSSVRRLSKTPALGCMPTKTTRSMLFM